MARNKYPEQTVERIITVAAKLFAVKGYDKTTMQDILDVLKLSKGAIYHHFKSKEEIMEVVINYWLEQELTLARNLAARVKGANGKEKIRNLLFDYLTAMHEMYSGEATEVLQYQYNDPKAIIRGVTAGVKDIAPIFSKLIEEGIADGSLQTDTPLETAEIILLLFSVWTKPTIFNWTEEQTRKRLEVLKSMFPKLGLDILTDSMIEQYLADYRAAKVF